MPRHQSKRARRMARLGLFATVAFALASSSCALKKPPDATAIREQALPALEVPGAWTATGAGTGAVLDSWVTGFNDAQLTASVAEAIANNADLRVAAARVEQAQLYARLAGAKTTSHIPPSRRADS